MINVIPPINVDILPTKLCTAVPKKSPKKVNKKLDNEKIKVAI